MVDPLEGMAKVGGRRWEESASEGKSGHVGWWRGITVVEVSRWSWKALDTMPRNATL